MEVADRPSSAWSPKTLFFATFTHAVDVARADASTARALRPSRGATLIE
jgi:hypothetical protein